MDKKTEGLLLRAVDYGENDKMVTLLTADSGKLGAAMKGVKKAGAKLKFASQPFCFAEYVLAEKGGRFTVREAYLHEGFYGLRESVEKFYAACSVTEIANIFSCEGQPSLELLVASVGALKFIESEELGTVSAVARYLWRVLTISGYPVTAGDCAVCGKKIEGACRFDLATGSFVCASCGVGVPASAVTYRFLSGLRKGRGEETEDGPLRALRLLKTYAEYQTDATFSALSDFLAL